MKQNKPPVGFKQEFQRVTGGWFQYSIAGFLLHQAHPSLSKMVPEQCTGRPAAVCLPPQTHLDVVTLHLLIPLLFQRCLFL